MVRVDGQETARYPLNRNGTHLLNGGSNTLVIEGGAAYISEADCPDKICVRSGGLSRHGETAACLPHGLLLEVKGGSSPAQDDVLMAH